MHKPHRQRGKGAYLKETSPHARGQPGKSRIRRPSAVRGSAGEAVCISMSCTVIRCFAAVPGYGLLSPYVHISPAEMGPSGPIAGSVLQFRPENVP